MISSWNSVVKEDDIVFHLGDVNSYSLSKMKEIINKLKFYIIKYKIENIN